MRYEAHWAKEHSDLPATVFLAVGENEQVVGETWRNESLSTEALKLLRQVDNVRGANGDAARSWLSEPFVRVGGFLKVNTTSR